MKRLFFSIVFILLIMTISGISQAKVTGVCSNCHTMHNSQNGQAMATYGTDNWAGTGPNEALTRGTCLGCHGQGGTDLIINAIPQVYHTNANYDLAGGNFAYIPNHKTRVSGDQNTVGHNVIDLGYNEIILSSPPGDQHSTGITPSNFTCAGMYGCHGDRTVSGSFAAVYGAHHQGVSGKCDTADSVANSYRFLKSVMGHENMDDTYKYQDFNAQYHNEYYGATTPGSSSATEPANNTVSGLCAECHGYFHGSGLDEIGGTESPFKRHPTDIILKGSGEYSAYTTYSTEAPVARPTVYDTINTIGYNDQVTPGTDTVMCLSCHGAHATPYYKLMRWEYKGWPSTIDPPGSKGCATCHTSKD